MRTFWIVVVLCLAGCGAEEPASPAKDARSDTPAREGDATTGKEVADSLNAAQDRARAVESLLEEGKADIDAAVDAAEWADDD